MANYNFKKDVIEGELGEKVVMKDLERLGCEFLNDNKDYRYDLLVRTGNGNERTFEIKTDVFCKPNNDTGNLFIEFECRGKASGVDVTEAKYFATYYKHLNEIWYIRTETLRKIVIENKIKTVEFAGDSGSGTKGYLVPRYKFKELFNVRLVPKEWQS